MTDTVHIGDETWGFNDRGRMYLISHDDDEWDDEELYWYEDKDEELDLVLDCGLPGCLCVGYHLTAECHTTEMMEAYFDAAEDE